jgi:hypothetical protein
MPANFVKLWRPGKSSDYAQVNQDPNGRGERTYAKQDTYMVQFDGSTDAILVASNVDAIAAGLPELGKVYGGLFCSSVRPTRINESPYVWRVDVNLSTIAQQTSQTSNLWNLSLRKATASRDVTRNHDRLGLPLCNTFADLLPQLPTATLFDDVFAFSWTTSEAPNEAFEDMKGKLNDEEFSFTLCGITRSFEKSQAKCIQADFSVTKVINSTSGGTNQIAFLYQVEFAMQIRKPRWVWTAPNEGWRGFVDDSETIDLFRDGNGTGPVTNKSTPRTAPTKMDFDGFELLPETAQIILLPNDAIGQATPAAGRNYTDEGAFELEDVNSNFAPLFQLLHD